MTAPHEVAARMRQHPCAKYIAEHLAERYVWNNPEAAAELIDKYDRQALATMRDQPADEPAAPVADLMYPYAIAGDGWVQRIRVTSPFFAEHPDVGFGETLTYRGEEVTVVPYQPDGGVLVDDTAPGQPPATVNQRGSTGE